MMYQVTLRIEGFITLESPKRLKGDEIPVMLTVPVEEMEREATETFTVVESEITSREINSEAPC